MRRNKKFETKKICSFWRFFLYIHPHHEKSLQTGTGLSSRFPLLCDPAPASLTNTKKNKTLPKTGTGFKSRSTKRKGLLLKTVTLLKIELTYSKTSTSSTEFNKVFYIPFTKWIICLEFIFFLY